MAKRKRLAPARLDAAETPPAPAAMALGLRPPIADVAQDAAASAALTEVATELASARSEGRLIQKIPLTAIDPAYLVRDRVALDPDDMAALVASLTARGQQTPVELTDLGDGRYGLISGYRRVMALREIQTLNPGSDTVLAVVRPPREAGDAYRAMVEENEIRADLSFYERGRIVARAADAGVFADDQAALSALFAHVPRARRSKIKSFVGLVRGLDEVLRFPTALSEKLGLALAKRLSGDPGFVATLQAALRADPPRDPAAEVAVLSSLLSGGTGGARPKPQAIAVGGGLTLTRKPGGTVELSGRNLRDAEFMDRLVKTLKSLD